MKPPFGRALAVFALAAPLGAQTLPLPPPPAPADEEVAVPGAGAVPGAPGAAARPQGEGSLTMSGLRRWEYALGAGVGWDSNIDFLIPDGPEGVAVVPRAGLARTFWGPRGYLRATASGGWTGYPEHEDLSRYYGDAGLEGRYRPSPATEWRLGAAYGIGHSDSAQILLQQGVLLPLVRTQSVAGDLTLSHQFTSRTGVRVNARYYQTTFEAPGLIDGQSLRGTAGLERTLGSRTRMALRYGLENVFSDEAGRSYLTHFGSLEWTRTLSPHSALLLDGGASYTPDAERARLERQENFFGGATLTRDVGRSSLTLFVRREVTPAFGTGVSRLELRAGVSARIPIGRAWELRFMGTHVDPDTPPEVDQAYGSSAEGSAALGWKLGRRFEVTGEARYRRRGEAGSFPRIDAIQAGVYVTLLTPSWQPVSTILPR
jgi:hypothetical protein